MPMKDYTLTVREVLENLATLAESYEKVSRGGSPTGNYFFAINVADMAASLKAAQVLIAQLPRWIPVSERLPEEDDYVLACHEGGFVRIAKLTPEEDDMLQCWRLDGGNDVTIKAFTHWMPLPEPPEVK